MALAEKETECRRQRINNLDGRNQMNKRLLRISALIIILIAWGCDKPNELLRAPVVGIVQNNQVPILIKVANAAKVRIEYQKADAENSAFTEWGTLSDMNGLSTNLNLNNIDDDTEYKYRVEFENGKHSQWYQFKSFPAVGKPGKFSFVFSACMREKYLGFNIFEKIEQFSPTFVALLGDQMYGDYDGDLNTLEKYNANDSLRKKMLAEGETILSDKTVLQAFRNKYSRVFDENYQKMASRFPLMATWDDHDFGKDNSDGAYPYKDEAKRVFKENYPAYPFEDEEGGIYYKFSISDIDVFVLDARWYRAPMQNAEGEGKKMLGDEQLSWLFNGLKESKASVKIVFSSVSLNDYGGDTSSGRLGYDSWMGYKFERNKFLSFVEENNIPGVLVFSGDQHYPSAHILNWQAPLNAVSHSEKVIEYSLHDLGSAVFDFSASPLNYKRAAGHPLIPENQGNPAFSFEIFRPDWAMPRDTAEDTPLVIGSVFGLAEVDTESSPRKVSVTFYEVNPEIAEMAEIFRVGITF